MSFQLSVTSSGDQDRDLENHNCIGGDDVSIAESAFSDIVCNQMLFGSMESVQIPNIKRLRKNANYVPPNVAAPTLTAPGRRKKEVSTKTPPAGSTSMHSDKAAASVTDGRKSKEMERRANNISQGLEDLLNRVHAYEDIDVQKLSEVQKVRRPYENTGVQKESAPPQRVSHLSTDGKKNKGDTSSWFESSLSEQNQSHLMKIMERKRKQREAAMKAAGMEPGIDAQLHLSTSVGKKMPALPEDSTSESNLSPTTRKSKKADTTGESSSRQTTHRYDSPRKGSTRQTSPQKSSPEPTPSKYVKQSEPDITKTPERQTQGPSTKDSQAPEIPKISDASMKEIATRKIQEAFHSVGKDENGYIDEAAFQEAIKQLDLGIGQNKAKILFANLDMIDMGCLCFEEFHDGVMDDVMDRIRKNPYPVSPNAQVRAEFIIKASEGNPAIMGDLPEKSEESNSKEGALESQPSILDSANELISKAEKSSANTNTEESNRPNIQLEESDETYGDDEISPPLEAATFEASHEVKSPVNSEDMIMKESRSKCKALFEKIPKEDDNKVAFEGFRKAFDDIEVDWDIGKIRALWKNMTIGDNPKITYGELESSLLNVIKSTFNYVAGPDGCNCLSHPENDAKVVERLPPNQPLVVVGFVNKFGQLNGGTWIRQNELVKYRSLQRRLSTLSAGPEEYNSSVRFDMTPSFHTIASRDSQKNVQEPEEDVSTPDIPMTVSSNYKEYHAEEITRLPIRSLFLDTCPIKVNTSAPGHSKNVSVESFHSCDVEPTPDRPSKFDENTTNQSENSSKKLSSSAYNENSTNQSDSSSKKPASSVYNESGHSKDPDMSPYAASTLQVAHDDEDDDISEQPPERDVSREVPEVLYDCLCLLLHEYGVSENKLTGLPATKVLVQDGAGWVRHIEAGQVGKSLAAVAFYIEDLESNPRYLEILPDVGSLASRYSALYVGQKVYHPHPNLFLLLTQAHQENEVESWEARAMKYMRTRCLRDFGYLKFVSKSVFYEKGEGFGRFIERLIQKLEPKVDLVTEEARERLDELLYNVVSDRSNFKSYANEILYSQKDRKWNEAKVCECIRKLAKRGAKGNYKDAGGHGVVMHAMRRGHNKIIQTILTEYPQLVKPRELNSDRMNVLMIALYYKRVSDANLIYLIRNFDIDHTIEDKRKRNTMVHALNGNRYSIAVELATKGAFDAPKALRDATKTDDVHVVKKMFKQGLQMQNDIDENGTTLGCLAAQNDAVGILKFLIRLRTNMGTDSLGNTAIHHAAMFTKNRALEILLSDARADINQQSKSGETALHIAASQGSLETVEALLNAGADINIVDNSKTSPLMRAAALGFQEICENLLRRGADYSLVDENGSSAQDLAQTHGHTSIVNSISGVE